VVPSEARDLAAKRDARFLVASLLGMTGGPDIPRVLLHVVIPSEARDLAAKRDARFLVASLLGMTGA